MRHDEGAAGARGRLRPYLAVALLLPLLASTLGIDGGAVFQIVAVEELGLSAGAVGIAFGLGVLSVPVQLAAARMPLWRARSNLRGFLAFGTAATLLLAVIVATTSVTSTLAPAALALTVVAEIALSVLYATAWQPLLAYGLTARDRQRVSSRGRATGATVLAVALVAFGLLPTAGRVVFIVLVAGCSLAMVLAVGRFAAPPRPVRPRGPRAAEGLELRLPTGVVPILLALGAAGFAGWPLFLIYSRQVLWPAANLGLVGAVQLAGSLGAAFAWTATTGSRLLRRARLAAGGVVVTSAALLLVRAPVDEPAEAAAVLLFLLVAAASWSTLLLALLELAHGRVTDDTSVRTLTIFDVVGSTSFQAGLLAAGFLVEASDHARRVDAYRLSLVLASLVLLALVLRIRTRS